MMSPAKRMSVVFGLAAMVALPEAEAADAKVHPGTMCVKIGSSGTLSYSNGKVRNTSTSSSLGVYCSIVRDHTTSIWDVIEVRVRSDHPTIAVSCTAYSRDKDGGFVDSESDSAFANTGGFQTLEFTEALSEEDKGMFYLSCTIPPYDVGSPNYSEIASYYVKEP